MVFFEGQPAVLWRRGSEELCRNVIKQKLRKYNNTSSVKNTEENRVILTLARAVYRKYIMSVYAQNLFRVRFLNSRGKDTY